MVNEIEDVRHQTSIAEVLLENSQHVVCYCLQLVKFALRIELTDVTGEGGAGTLHQALRQTPDARYEPADDRLTVRCQPHDVHPQLERLSLRGEVNRWPRYNRPQLIHFIDVWNRWFAIENLTR